MTNISKKKLPAKNFKRLFTQLNTTIGNLNAASSEKFFNDLLGPEEKVMLTKRLAAVVMFIEGNSSYRVYQLLQLSPSTAESIRRDYESGRYAEIQKMLTANSTDYRQLWTILETILQAGMPPQGRDRWKSIFSQR